MTEPRQSSRRSTVLIAAAIALLVIVAGVVGAATWRARSDSPAQPTPAATETSRPSPSPTPEQEAADKALAAYNNYREAQVAAFATAEPTGGDLSKYVADPLLGELQYDLRQKRDQGLIVTGRPVWKPRVTKVNVTSRPFTVQIEDCFDATNWNTVYKATGKSAAVPGQNKKYVVTAEAALYDDGRWLIRSAKAERERPC